MPNKPSVSFLDVAHQSPPFERRARLGRARGRPQVRDHALDDVRRDLLTGVGEHLARPLAQLLQHIAVFGGRCSVLRARGRLQPRGDLAEAPYQLGVTPRDLVDRPQRQRRPRDFFDGLRLVLAAGVFQRRDDAFALFDETRRGGGEQAVQVVHRHAGPISGRP
jgi:hypothetical protein